MIFKKLSLTCFLLVLTLPIYTQNYIFKYTKTRAGFWGFADINGRTIIEPSFMKCSDFSNCGVALVFYTTSNECDLININGQIIQTESKEFEYKHSTISTLNGFISISNNNKYGFLNSRGQIAIPMKYNKATDFNENFAIVEKESKFYVIDTNGVEILINIPKIIDFDIFSEGLARIKNGDTNFVYINTKGNIVFSIQAYDCSNFNYGLASSMSIDKKAGFIDKLGNWKINPQFERAHNFDIESGMALVKLNKEWVYVDSLGNILNIESYGNKDDFSNGLVRGFVFDKNSEISSTLVGFKNNKGEWVIDPIFENARPFKYGYAAVRYGGKWGFIDKTGKWIIKPTYGHVGNVNIVN